MSQISVEQSQPTTPPTIARRGSWAWLGVLPFVLFALIFLIWPAASLLVDSFRDAEGRFTLANIAGLSDPTIVAAYWLSVRISFVTAVGGGIFGFLLAYAVTQGGLPRWVRSGLLSFSGVAANFAGRAAGVRLCGDARAHRPRHSAAEVAGDRPVRRGLQLV